MARYAGRTRPAVVVTEVAEARGSAAEIRRREAAALLAALPANAFAVALDMGGEALGHRGFAATAWSAGWRAAGRCVS